MLRLSAARRATVQRITLPLLLLLSVAMIALGKTDELVLGSLRILVLDAAMMGHDILNYHPLDNTMTTSIGSADLLKFLAATGHAPRIEAVSERSL